VSDSSPMAPAWSVGTFERLLDAAPDAIICVGVDGRIELVNDQVERLFGYQRGELLGQTIELLVPLSAASRHPGLREGYFADPRPRPMGAGRRLAARRKDGAEFLAEISLSAVTTDGGVIVLAAVRDVTDRERAEEERERLRDAAQRRELESQHEQSQRLESLGQLAGGVAHDFNNLLAVILNYGSFVEEALAAGATEGRAIDWVSVLDDVRQIRRAATRATQLTHQLLAFGRREVAKPRIVNLNQTVQDVEQLLRRTLGEHVDLVVTLRPELAAILADPGQLEQILVNLAINARDAMPSGGSLTIETGNVTVDEAYATQKAHLQPGEHVRLRVSDTGSGMPPEVVRRAFEPFFTTKPKGEGTGLGLATVYGIVTQAGGHIHIYSEPGVGTTVSILFPVTAGRVQEKVPLITSDVSSHGETVLVVEDEAALREVTRRILRRNGYKVLTTDSAPEAVALAEDYAGTIHLLLTDVVMPKLLGKEVAEQVLARRPEVRVLYMSGYAQPVLASHGSLEAGVLLLEKPFTEQDLLTKVRVALGSPPVVDRPFPASLEGGR